MLPGRELLAMVTSRTRDDWSWFTEPPPMYESWEWWQWLLPIFGLVISWVLVMGGWIVRQAEGGGCLGAAGLLGTWGGSIWALMGTLSLMRHMSEQWGTYVLTAFLVIAAALIWGFLTYFVSIPYESFLGAFIPFLTLAGGALIALGLDAWTRHMAGIPASLLMLVLVGAGLFAFATTAGDRQ